MPNVTLDSALHHCASVVVLDEVFPTWLWQIVIFGESLLAEVLNGVVVCICQEVVQFFRLCVILQLVHQTRAISLDLLLCSDG